MEKTFTIITENNIRTFIQELNNAKVTKDDIVKIFYKPANSEYTAIIYK